MQQNSRDIMAIVIKSQAVQNFINKSGKIIRSPEQRLILGVTALATQPVIDLTNKRVDEDTRVLSCCRTIAKIIAGTTSGVVVRAGCNALIEHFSKGNRILSPLRSGRLKNIDPIQLKNYANTLGSVAAIGVMLFTNFIWDGPVTKKLTNLIYNKAAKKEPEVK